MPVRPAFPLGRARLLLPLLLMMVACGREAAIQDPTASQPKGISPSALLAPPRPPGGWRVHAAPSRPEPEAEPPTASSCTGGCPGTTSVVDFELFTNPTVFHQLTTQYDSLGVIFDSTLVLVAPGYFYQNYPPRSGAAVATADFTQPGGGSGILYFSFPNAGAVRVRLYVTSLSPVTLRCFDAGGAEVGTTVFAGGNTVETQGGVPNQPVEVSAPGIRSCRLVGQDNQYGIDDLTVVWEEGVTADLTCDSMIRGQSGACRVTGGATVLGWQFTGILGARLLGQDSLVVVASATSDTVWSGVGVLLGVVSAFVQTGSTVDTLTAPWTVSPRTGPDWRWSEANWFFEQDGPAICGYSDFTLPFSGEFPGRLAVNRRRSDCGDGGSIEPNLRTAPDAGTNVAQVSSGPNEGLWYITASTFHLDRVTEMNPFIRPGGPIHLLPNGPDYSACKQALGLQGNPPINVSFHQFNTVCKGFDLNPMYDGIWAHEGLGTQDPLDSATANGHEARRRIAARDLANDPNTLIEGFTSPISPSTLRDLVRDSVLTVDARISAFAGDATGLVRDNYLDPAGGCGKAFVFRTSPNPPRYVFFTLTQSVAGATLCP